MIPRFKPALGWREILALFRLNGQVVEKFEKDFAKKFQAVDAVAFPYGRSAQWAFFKALGIEDAEIIMPAYTCSVVAHAITLSGNVPRFIDIDLHDYNMNLDLAEAAINEKTRVVVSTHTFGIPQDLEKLERIVDEAEKKYGHKIWLMQDCCHAFGAKWNHRMIGESGDVAVYAFNISKIMTSIFGGMLTFQNKNLASKVRKWRDANFNKASLKKKIMRRIYLLCVFFAFNRFVYPTIYWLQHKTPFLNRLTKAYHLDDKIHFPPDFLMHMSDVEAEVGLIQLKKYDEIVDFRRKMAEQYQKEFETREDWKLPPLIEGTTFSHFPVKVKERNALVREYQKKGIELGILIDYSIDALPCYQSLKANCPNSRECSSSMVNFPVSKL